MSHKLALNLFFLLFSVIGTSQSSKTNAFTISSELKEHANAVIRHQSLEIEIKDYNKMIVTEHRIVTVLNEYGIKKTGAYLGYDDAVNIKEVKAIVYDALGEEIKSFKEKEFKDVSSISGGTLFSDNREKYLSYTPSSYPYTVEFETQYVTSTTAFMPRLMQ